LVGRGGLGAGNGGGCEEDGSDQIANGSNFEVDFGFDGRIRP